MQMDNQNKSGNLGYVEVRVDRARWRDEIGTFAWKGWRALTSNRGRER